MAIESIKTQGLDEITTEDSEVVYTEGETAFSFGQAYGLKISLPGHSIWSNTPEDFVLDTSQNRLKIHSEYHDTYTMAKLDEGECPAGVPTAPCSFTITHNLGYYPMVWFFVKDDMDSRFHLAPLYYPYYPSGGAPTPSSTGLVAGYEVYTTGTSPNYTYDYDKINFWIGRFSPFLYDGDNNIVANIEYKILIFVDPAKDAWYE